MEHLEKTQVNYDKQYLNFLKLQRNVKDFYLENKENLTPTQIRIIEIILISKNRKACLKSIEEQTNLKRGTIVSIISNLNHKKVNNRHHLEFLKLKKELMLHFEYQTVLSHRLLISSELKKVKIILTSNDRKECINRFMNELGMKESSAKSIIPKFKKLIQEEELSILRYTKKR